MFRNPLSGLFGYDFKLRERPMPVSVEDYRLLARRALPKMVWVFLENGADDETTLQRNRADFDRWRLRQKVLTGLKNTDLSVQVAGERVELPVALSPAGLNGLFHWHGERGAARAAEQCGTRHVMSTGASYTYEEVAAGTRESHWFQLYPWKDHQFLGSMVDRAKRSGFGAMFVTVDVPVVGNREGEKRVGLGSRPVVTPRRVLDGIVHPRWSYGYLRHRRFVIRAFSEGNGSAAAIRAAQAQASFMRPDLLNWETLAWLRDTWSGPLYVKGITEPEDAVRCIDLGCDGVVVSNHGGRQLDDMISSIDALPAVASAIDGRGAVLIDGGIRRGTDVVKALCLGATACLIGRPFLYGLSVGGEQGVIDILTILRTEIDTTLKLMGCASVKELGPSWIERVGDRPSMVSGLAAREDGRSHVNIGR